MKVYIDGKYYNEEDAKVSVFDHGLLYGDGVFEGIRIYNGKAFKLNEHIKRLYESARAILLNIPMTQKEMEETVLESIAVNDKKDGYIRLIVTRGKGDLGIDPGKCGRATVIIIVADIQLYPCDYYEKGIELICTATRRVSFNALDTRVKSLNYLNNILGKIEAKQAGVLEAVMLNEQGIVAECTADNIFIVKGGMLYTPHPLSGALKGITLDTLMKIAQEEGINAEYATLTRFDLYNADECFMTGTGCELMPVVRIDGRIIGEGTPGKITKKLITAFKKLIA